MPLKKVFRAFVTSDVFVHSMFAAVHVGERCGWAEVTPLAAPFYLPEWAAGVFALVRDHIGPHALNLEFAEPEDLWTGLQPFRGNQFAKALFDVAIWDVMATQRGLPLWRAIGGQEGTISVGGDVGLTNDRDELVSDIRAAVESGVGRVKLKIGPGRDYDVIRTARHAFPDVVFHVDCNACYTLKDIDLLRRIDEFGLAMIEQPLGYDDILDHAALQRQIATPVCLDETITSIERAAHAIAAGACRFINIKVPRVGGITQARRIYDICRDNDVGCWVGGMLESAVGQAATMAIATLPGCNYPGDIFASDAIYAEDVGDPRVVIQDGKATPLPRVGLGARPSSREFHRVIRDRATLQATHPRET